MRSVLSSTAAFSTEWPSSNARSSDRVTSEKNSDSAAAVESAWIDCGVAAGLEMEEREEVRESGAKEETSLSSPSSSRAVPAVALLDAPGA